MLDQLPLRWLIDQHVPLIFFILALLTEPKSWSKAAVAMVNQRLGGIEGGNDNDN
jgi:hypothetical protein